MAFKLVIAEKPKVGIPLAKIIGANTPHIDKAVGYMEGNGYKVTWAFGHLVGLNRPEEMGFPGATLPIFPKEWKTHIIESGNESTAAGVKKQMKLLEGLFNTAEEIIVATDAGREGELIFRYIYEYFGCKTPFKRLWISSLTTEAIKKGFRELRDGEEMEALSDAAHARSEADYLVGFNASRALRLASNYKGLLSLGRVQTPVLCMVCDRYEANKNFVPTPFWQISAELHKDMTNFEVLSKMKYKSEDEAKKDEELVSRSKQMRVTSVEKKHTKSKQPLLYDLTTLQRIANRKYGLTAAETLKIAQSLYEQKYLSYPRTGSRYIPEDVFKTIPALIGKVGEYKRFTEAAEALRDKKLCRRSVDDTKITDHHALLPTEVIPTDLTGTAKQIWELVAGRMLEAFGEEAEYDRTAVEFNCEGIIFTATGSVLTKAGWKAVFGAEAVEDKSTGKEDDEESNARLPRLEENEILPAGQIKTLRKTDKPLPIYTDDSLLGDMQTCGKQIEDEELREAIKDVGLGTPATRDAIIETLIARKYIVRQTKKLIPTDLGMSIAKTVKGRKIADVKTTGEWEHKLSQMERKEITKESFDQGIMDYVLEIIDDLQKNCTSLEGVTGLADEPTRSCPCCGKPMKNLKFSIACDPDSGGCGFKIPRAIAEKKLPDAAIEALAQGKTTGVIKGLKSKSGKTFDCKLKVDKEQKKIAFQFDEAPKMEQVICPCCGKEMADDKWKLECGCGFKLYKTQGGVTLDEKRLKALLSGSKILVTGMKSMKTGKRYDAWLKINTQEKKIDLSFDKTKK